MKHDNGGNCKRCAEMLEEAHEQIRYWYYRIEEAFPDVHVDRVWCGKEMQDQLVADKKSLLKWPNSKHNHMEDGKPCSLAMDLFRLIETAQGQSAEFRAGFYVQIANWIDDQNAPIEWGGSWKHFKDLDHFQLKA